MPTLTINAEPITVADGTTVAAAILSNGVAAFRTSVNGGPRGPLCGMGVCFECCVTINGLGHQRSCTALVEDGMEVMTRE